MSPKEQQFPILMVDVEGEKIGTATWILCWGLAAWEMVRRSAAPLPLLLRNKYHPTARTQKPVQCVKTWDFYKKGAGYSEWLG